MPSKKEKGFQGFSQIYWNDMYSAPETMDGIFNAKEHCAYLKSLLALEYIDVSTMIDLGAGYGHLFKYMLKTFLPYKAMAIEPSAYAFQKLSQKKLAPVSSTQLKIEQTDLVSWCQSHTKGWTQFDLGLCTSVWQYLDAQELDFILPILSKRIKYLYLTVPTDLELKRQVETLQFQDTYAKKRSQQWYLRKIRPYFHVVSSRLLESKTYFDTQSTHFTDLLFRF